MMDKNFYDSDEEKLKADQQKESEHQYARLVDDVKWMLASGKGRRILWWFWSLCNTFGQSYVAKDASATAFNEGQRSVGLQLLRLVYAANPKAFSQIQDEILAEENKKKDEKKKENSNA